MKKNWENIISRLNVDAEFLIPNLFDFCEKEKTFDEMHSGLEKFLEKFDEKIFLCGLSLGGILALKYTISHNEKVAGLIVIGARMKFPKFLMFLQNIVFRFLPEKNFLKIGMKKSEFLKFSRSISRFDISRDISQISCPVGIFIGEKDFVNKNEVIRIARKIKNSKLIFIKNSNHEVNIDSPVLLAEEIEEFYTKIIKN